MTSYTIRKFNGETLIEVPEGSVNSQTLLTIPGKNIANYGEMIGEDFIRLLENFAGTTAPTVQHPDKIFLNGQLWFDTDKSLLKVYQKKNTLNAPAEWIPVNKILVSSSLDVVGDYEGQLFWHTATKLLYAWNATDSEWKLVGPVDISELEDQLEDLTNRLETLETNSSGYNVDITNLLSRMTSAETNIGGLTTRMGTAEAEIDELQDSVDDLLGRTTQSETDLNGLTGRVVTLEGEMDTAEASLVDHDGRLDDLRTEVDDHETRIDALEVWRTSVAPTIEDLDEWYDTEVVNGILGAVRRWYQDPDWLVHWKVPVYVDADTMRIDGGDFRDYFEVGKTIRARLGGSTYRYGSVTAVSYGGGNTTIDATWDSALTAALDEVALALVEASEVQAAEIPSGSRMLFYQASAPSGWTQVTTVNEAMLRVVSGTGGGSGGDLDFSSVFTERTENVAGLTEGSSVTVDTHAGDSGTTGTVLPEHNHADVITSTPTDAQGVAGALVSLAGTYYTDPGPEEGPVAYTVTVYSPGNTADTGTAAGEHAHTIDHTHTTQLHSHDIDIDMSLDLSVKYADVIICQKT